MVYLAHFLIIWVIFVALDALGGGLQYLFDLRKQKKKKGFMGASLLK
jgi:hypothetical protein